jgi:hypothetical protein
MTVVFSLMASGFRLQASSFRGGFILHTCEREWTVIKQNLLSDLPAMIRLLEL